MLTSFLSFRQKAAADDHDKENAGNRKKMQADGGKLKKKTADSGKEKNSHVSSLITTTRPARVSLESQPIPRKKKSNKRKRQPGKPKDHENSPAPKE